MAHLLWPHSYHNSSVCAADYSCYTEFLSTFADADWPYCPWSSVNNLLSSNWCLLACCNGMASDVVCTRTCSRNFRISSVNRIICLLNYFDFYMLIGWWKIYQMSNLKYNYSCPYQCVVCTRTCSRNFRISSVNIIICLLNYFDF